LRLWLSCRCRISCSLSWDVYVMTALGFLWTSTGISTCRGGPSLQRVGTPNVAGQTTGFSHIQQSCCEPLVPCCADCCGQGHSQPARQTDSQLGARRPKGPVPHRWTPAARITATNSARSTSPLRSVSARRSIACRRECGHSVHTAWRWMDLDGRFECLNVNS
jgi:hypothetical protein